MIETSSTDIPSTASVVVVGGGAMGCSLLYHLAKAGISDAVMLERNALTSGTTWHSAAQVRALRSSRNLTSLIKRSIKLYQTLESETGHSTGWINRGSLSIATHSDRLVHIRRQKGLADLYDLEAHEIGADEVAQRWPLMNSRDVLGAIWSPEDGRVSPSDLCQSLIRGATDKGVRVFEQTAVEGILTRNNKIYGVVANGTTIKCDTVALCSGLWSRENSLLTQHAVPVWPCHHYYLLTEPLAGFEQTLPTLSDHDQSLYIRDDSGGLLVGCFEAHAKAINPQLIGHDSPFNLLQEDWDHFEPVMNAAIHRIPALENAGVRSLLNGPESFTPDGNFLLGESSMTRGLYLGCGMNSVGLASAGGAGWALCEAITNGSMPFDLAELDPQRFHPCYSEIETLSKRVPEVLGKHYAISYPGRQWQTTRKLRKLPLDDLWREHSAVMGQVNGWERPLYFDEKTSASSYPRHTTDDDLTFAKPSWFDSVGEEVAATSRGVGLFELSTFGRFRFKGVGAKNFLQYLCSNRINIKPGRCSYTLLLNDRGGIEFDAVVLRIDEEEYLLSIGSAHVQNAATWIERCFQDFSNHGLQHLPIASIDLFIENISESTAVIAVAGPGSDALLSELCENFQAPGFFSHKRFNFGFNGTEVTVACLSYTGERGFEIICSADEVLQVAREILSQDVKPAGLYAQTSMRIEKGFSALGHELDSDVTPFDVGLGAFVDMQQTFLGRDKLKSRSAETPSSKLIYLSFEESDLIALGNEPVYWNGKLIGKTTSASFGYRLKRQVAIAQVDSKLLRSETTSEQTPLTLFVDNGGTRMQATATGTTLFDPKSLLPRTQATF